MLLATGPGRCVHVSLVISRAPVVPLQVRYDWTLLAPTHPGLVVPASTRFGATGALARDRDRPELLDDGSDGLPPKRNNHDPNPKTSNPTSTRQRAS